MSSLPSWAAWVIVAVCPLLGPAIAFLVFLVVVVLDNWITGARGAPDPVPELVYSEPAVAVLPGSSPPI